MADPGEPLTKHIVERLTTVLGRIGVKDRTDIYVIAAVVWPEPDEDLRQASAWFGWNARSHLESRAVAASATLKARLAANIDEFACPEELVAFTAIRRF